MMKITITNALQAAGLLSGLAVALGAGSPAAAYAPLISHAHSQSHWVPGAVHWVPGPPIFIPARTNYNPLTGDYEVHPAHYEPGPLIMIQDPPIWVPDVEVLPY